jgi:hypothetical protein
MRESVVTMGIPVDVLMRRLALWLQALTATGLLAEPALGDNVQTTREVVALAERVRGTKDSLIKGLSASARYSDPNAVAFELQQGRLQLSVCTVRRETFWNVMVDPTPGRRSRSSRSRAATPLPRPTHSVRP